VINRVYAVGFEGLTFSSINDGKSYVEDAEAIKNNNDEVTPYYIMDARIKHPQTLLFMAKELLEMATNKKIERRNKNGYEQWRSMENFKEIGKTGGC
jgi:hypothetical protein